MGVRPKVDSESSYGFNAAIGWYEKRRKRVLRVPNALHSTPKA